LSLCLLLLLFFHFEYKLIKPHLSGKQNAVNCGCGLFCCFFNSNISYGSNLRLDLLIHCVCKVSFIIKA